MRYEVGQVVRYTPGTGTYGYEDGIEADGRVPGVVVGHSPTRVRVELVIDTRLGVKVRRCVAPESLSAA